MKTIVYIDPSVRIKYASFYIKGLYDIFGKENVRFSRKYFKDLKRRTESHSYDHYMAFVTETGKEINKYIIDFRDKRSVKQSAYNWCDKYAKINFSPLLTNKRFHQKIVSIPPGFGINIWGKFDMAYYCISNLLKCKLSPLVSLKTHLLDYYLQMNRPALADYNSQFSGKVDSPYVFMIGTLWNHDNCTLKTNLLRRKFVEICKLMKLNFEGGFFSSIHNPQYEKYKNLIFTERYSTMEYLEKTKKSTFVFNTPAVHDCHGWKLGEYLAMGKAIISSPLSNELPEPMIHGKNIHFVSNVNEMQNSISLLLSENSYRKILEDGARDYYLKFGSPKAVINNLVLGNTLK